MPLEPTITLPGLYFFNISTQDYIARFKIGKKSANPTNANKKCNHKQIFQFYMVFPSAGKIFHVEQKNNIF
jgi:hypothetical protein